MQAPKLLVAELVRLAVAHPPNIKSSGPPLMTTATSVASVALALAMRTVCVGRSTARKMM